MGDTIQPFSRRSLIPILALFWLGWGFPWSAIAQKPSKFESCVLEPDILADNGQPTRPGVITAYTFSPEEPTIPSLWWAQEQFSEGKLLTNWVADPEAKRLDLIVNWQLWSQLRYVERYTFIHHFGTVARDYGYQLRVFNQRQECLATYTCNFSTSSPSCSIDFEPSARGRLRL